MESYLFERPITGRITLATFRGTFITGGQEHRRGLFIPTDEDTAFEEEFVNANDPLHVRGDLKYDGYPSHNDEEVEERGLAEQLLGLGILSSEQLRAAAEVILENPELLVTLYREGINPELYREDQRKRVREKSFDLIQKIVIVATTIRPRQDVERKFRMCRVGDSQRSVFYHFVEFARREATRHFHHHTAIKVLEALGHPDPFERLAN